MNGNLAKVDPPIILGQSALFPNSKPLSAEWFYLVFERRIKNTTELLPMITDFQTALKYDKLEQATGTEMLIRPDLLFMPLSNAKLGKGNSWDLTPLLTPLTDWLSVKAFNNPAEIVQVNIDPTEPEVFEGQKFEFTGSIVPKPGLGTGEITDKGGSLDLLDGYESQTVEKLDWDALFHPHQDLWKTGSGFDFQFEPKKGTGTYEILASTVVSLKEKDTGSLAKASGISSTTALVKPGFRILTPLEKFAYPVGMPIKVTTTQDGEAAWASITWSMNGKPWKPQEQEAPATFIPDKEGDWVLAGELIVKDENDQDVVLQDKVKFPVKPVTIQLSPVRKVVSPHPKAVPFTLLVKLGKTEITNTNQVVEWAPKTMSAKIETIEWKGFTSPTTAVDMSGLDPLTREANLKNDGPMTVLATVTVRFWSTDPQKPFDETFSFPAARADLWAVPEPSWKTVEGHLFLNAIAGAKRTFAPKTGSFNLGNDTHSWSIEHGVDPEISLAPARE